jgi:hypothetical protein
VAADVKRVEDALRKRLGTDVRITARRRGRGLVTISYYSNDDLARLLERYRRPFGRMKAGPGSPLIQRTGPSVAHPALPVWMFPAGAFAGSVTIVARGPHVLYLRS